jgi:gibberellin A4 carboxyl methyltransferase
MAFQQHSLQGYNKASSIQLKANLQQLPVVFSHLLSLQSSNPSLILIADYGCSEGFNSNHFFNQLLSQFRAQFSTPVQITHTDLPNNNWTVVNSILNESPESYLRLPNVFSATLGRSFFNQLFPNNSILLGVAFFSFHYFSTKPVREPGEEGFLFKGFVEQGLKDMRTLIRHRVNELASGGFLIFIIPYRSSVPNMAMAKIFFGAFQKLAQAGTITEQQLKRITWNYYIAAIEEWRSALEEFTEEIEIVKQEEVKVLYPEYENYVADGDLEKYKEGLMKSIAILLKMPLFSVLDDDEIVKEEAMKRLEEVLKELIEESRDSVMYMDTMTTLIRKK